jgi:hypothetical protein
LLVLIFVVQVGFPDEPVVQRGLSDVDRTRGLSQTGATGDQHPRHLQLVVVQLQWPAAGLAAGTRGGPAGRCPLADLIALALGQCRQDVVDDAAGYRPRVDAVGQQQQPDLSCLKFLHQVGKDRDLAAKPVQLPRNQHVTRPRVVQCRAHLRPVLGSAARLLHEHPVAPGGLQRIELKIKILIRRGNPGVPDGLTHGVLSFVSSGA